MEAARTEEGGGGDTTAAAATLSTAKKGILQTEGGTWRHADDGERRKVRAIIHMARTTHLPLPPPPPSPDRPQPHSSLMLNFLCRTKASRSQQGKMSATTTPRALHGPPPLPSPYDDVLLPLNKVPMSHLSGSLPFQGWCGSGDPRKRGYDIRHHEAEDMKKEMEEIRHKRDNENKDAASNVRKSFPRGPKTLPRLFS